MITATARDRCVGSDCLQNFSPDSTCLRRSNSCTFFFFFFVVCLPPVEIFCKLWKGRRKNFCRNSRFTETFVFIILVVHKLSSFLSPLRTWSKGSSYLNSLFRRFLVLYLLGYFGGFLRNGRQPKDIVKYLFTSRDD